MQRATFALVRVDALVDAFMAHAGLFVDQKVATDLLWTPRFFELALNDIPSLGLNPRPIGAGLFAGLCE